MNAAALERLLQREIQLYKEYLHVLSQERAFTTRFNAEKLATLTDHRETLLALMKRAHEERLHVVAPIAEHRKEKLSAIIDRSFQGHDKARLMRLAAELKGLIAQSQKQTQDFGIIARFGLSVAEGVLSILWSATQNVTKGYSRQGVVTESATPANTRAASVLKKA